VLGVLTVGVGGERQQDDGGRHGEKQEQHQARTQSTQPLPPTGSDRVVAGAGVLIVPRR
jgi:hypothetical protein